MMVAYSFKAQFVEPILAGTKGGTIRASRRRSRTATGSGLFEAVGGHALPGEELQLYSGIRTRQCRLIARTRCVAVEPIELEFIYFPAVVVGNLSLSKTLELDAFARFDGFESWPEMAAFFRGPRGKLDHFTGWHIRWLPLPEKIAAQSGKREGPA